MVQIRPNKTKRKLEQGGTVIALAGCNDAEFVDHIGPLGFDAAWIEAEHGPVDFRDIPDISRACDLWSMTSIVRVNVNLPGVIYVIYRTLDVGAQGIIVPHVNTSDEAQAVVDAAKFGPIGHRCASTSRQGYDVPDYVARANDETLVVVLIEDVVAVDNLADILAVENIDVFYLAPVDLAQSMGFTGQMHHPEVQTIVDKAVQQIIAAGRVAGAGGMTSPSMAIDEIGKGVRFLSMYWPFLLASAATGFLQEVAEVTE